MVPPSRCSGECQQLAVSRSTQAAAPAAEPSTPWASQHLLLALWRFGKEPSELTCVILITSLTKAMAFSGWNLQVPFCGDREELLEPVPGCAVPRWPGLCWEYLGPVGVSVLPHEPLVVQDVLEGLAGQAPVGQQGSVRMEQFIRVATMSLDGSTATFAGQSHQHSPLKALPPARQTGRGSAIPEPPEAQTLFLQHLPAWPTTLPGTVTPHSAGSLERNQEP